MKDNHNRRFRRSANRGQPVSPSKLEKHNGLKAPNMNHHKFVIVALLCILSTLTCPTAELHADDPLKAFPTPEKPVEQRVKELTEAELQAIRTPQNADQLVLSIATVPSGAKQEVPAEAKPWLRTFADGRIECGSLMESQSGRRHDTLTKAELVWLLHLAVNKCQILSRSTNDIEEDYRRQDRKHSANRKPPRHFQYHVNVSAGNKDLSVPEEALTLRPLRARMKLGAFASLHKYASYLVARAYLGDSTARQALLDQLNSKLQTERPNVPAFRMEHLGAAISTNTFDLGAAFQQEIELGNDKYEKVTGNIMRKEKGATPTFSIQTMKFSKGRF